MPISQVKPEALATLPTSTSTAGAGPTPSAFAQSYQAASEAAWGAVEGQKQKAGQALKVGYGPGMGQLQTEQPVGRAAPACKRRQALGLLVPHTC